MLGGVFARAENSYKFVFLSSVIQPGAKGMEQHEHLSLSRGVSQLIGVLFHIKLEHKQNL